MSSRYKILVDTVPSELENQVNLHLQDGYTVAQPMVAVSVGQYTKLFQVMIKYEDALMKQYGV